jgi:ABC-type dipeptide/oligopeptide/nickel transport system permease subunit
MKALRRFSLYLLAALMAFSLIVTTRAWLSREAPARANAFAVASSEHPLGTDGLGRDRMQRLAQATLLSLSMAAGAAALTTAFAAVSGLIAGSAGPRGQRFALAAFDLLMALPWVFLAMILRGVMPLDTPPLLATVSTYLLMACFGWPACARVVSRGVLSLRKSTWMAQQRANGIRELRLLGCHLLPNLRPILMAQFLVTLPAFVVTEINLGLLGLGTAEPLPSWGGMLRDLEGYGAWMGSRVQLVPLITLVAVTASLQLFLASEERC